MKLEDVRNIGTKTAEWLRDIGIHTAEELFAADIVDVYRRVRASRPGVNIMMLYGLQAALMDIHWNALPEDLKAELKKRAEAAEE